MYRFKAFFEEDFATRRFNLDEPAEGETLFNKLREKVGEILGPAKAFSFYWKDSDSSRIVCENNEDLKIAVEECASASTGITEIGVKPEVLRLPTPPPRVTKVPPHRERRKCECEHCGKRFKCKSHLLDHIRIHTGERPYQCDVCGNSYRHRSSLRGHMNSHTGAKPHKCTFPGCTYESAWSSYMAEHMRQMHGKRTAEKLPGADIFHPSVGFIKLTRAQSRAQRAQERNRRIETGMQVPLDPKPRKIQNKRKNTPIKRQLIPPAHNLDDAPLPTEVAADDEVGEVAEPGPMEDTSTMETSSPPEVPEDEDTLRAVGIRVVANYVHAQ